MFNFSCNVLESYIYLVYNILQRNSHNYDIFILIYYHNIRIIKFIRI